MTCSLPVRSWPPWTRRQYADHLGAETSVQTDGDNSRRVLLLRKYTRRNSSCLPEWVILRLPLQVGKMHDCSGWASAIGRADA